MKKRARFTIIATFTVVLLTGLTAQSAFAEKTMRGIKSMYNWAYVVRAYENR